MGMNIYPCHYTCLTIKKRKGKKVWADHINDNRNYIESLDKDDEIEEWLKPTKCER